MEETQEQSRTLAKSTSTSSIESITSAQRAFFSSGKTLSLEFRRHQLKKLFHAVKKNEVAIFKALQQDLRKPPVEVYVNEFAFVLDEIKIARRSLWRWMRPKRVWTPLVLWPNRSEIRYEPKGTVLVIAPWNYPFQLALSPLVGAIAAGNTTVLKPSEHAPRTAEVIHQIISSTFSQEFVAVVLGSAQVSSVLVSKPWDHIFFTGGTEVGRQVAIAAAETLSPVTLELGGKSPCIVDSDTDLEITARRIAWGKFVNAGQTCVAPDYLLVKKEMKAKLVSTLVQTLQKFFGADPKASQDYPRIINERHWDRLTGYLKNVKILLGGQSDRKDRYLAPTIVEQVPENHPLLSDEIFGPILPIVEYDKFDEAVRYVKDRPRPLALYLFSNSPQHQERVLNEISFGGGCINDTLVHVGNPKLPFGGIGPSGHGAYHGWYSFETFSHRKSVMRGNFLLDLALRYQPYGSKLRWIRRLL